ncbi:MAG TPA: hypothetical protein VMF08_11220 [Candidatus Sulfotelmatobacter sp.]|nr:hypothetical protein [Candidatus Sulfotelmatobacter sp.]
MPSPIFHLPSSSRPDPDTPGNDWDQAGNPRIESLGTVSLEPGDFEISVSPARIAGDELFRLRSLELRTQQN